MDQPSMRKTTLPYTTTGVTSRFIQDYLNYMPCLDGFYKYKVNLDAFEQVIADKSKTTLNREVLVSELTQQYDGIALTEEVRTNISLLANDNTFTITTAHQPNIFGGFLFFLNKILSTINIAEQLRERYPQFNFVPVYWIGGEDHDFEEINHIHLFGERLTWDHAAAGPVGRMDTAGMDDVINQIEEKLGGMPHATELLAMVRQAYNEHETLGKATLWLANELFGRFGLVVVDQDRKAYKEVFKHVIQDEILNNRVTGLINDTIESINQCNYKLQASPREINMFYLSPGRRDRIVLNDSTGHYEALGYKVFTKEELLDEIDQHPENFSPNVFLRPLLQETILPNLAYVGGGGEVAYWLELRSIFEHYGVNYPMLVLRSIAAILDKNACKKLQKLELSKEDLFVEEEALIKQYVKDRTTQSLELVEEKAETERIFNAIIEKAKAVDPTLAPSVEGAKQGQIKALETLETKILRAEKRNFEVAVNQIRGLKSKLFPGGTLMERVDNFLPFYAAQGPAFIDDLKQHLDPFEGQFVLLFEE